MGVVGPPVGSAHHGGECASEPHEPRTVPEPTPVIGAAGASMRASTCCAASRVVMYEQNKDQSEQGGMRGSQAADYAERSWKRAGLDGRRASCSTDSKDVQTVRDNQKARRPGGLGVRSDRRPRFLDQRGWSLARSRPQEGNISPRSRSPQAGVGLSPE